MKIVVTGIDGLIGWHLRCLLSSIKNIEVIGVSREDFCNAKVLQERLSTADAIVHLAGMNRGNEIEVAETNIRLTSELIDACRISRKKFHIVFSSSTHILRSSEYAKSKRKFAELFSDWAKESGSIFTNLILPNVFGEKGKPNYNSVVSTFCHQLAMGHIPLVEHDSKMNLLHAGEVAKVIYECLDKSTQGDKWVEGTEISVSGLKFRLEEFLQLYTNQIIPDVSNDFDRNLFNTLRYYLFERAPNKTLKLHEDSRGSLFEALKAKHGGQVFISSTKPNITRGNHFHLRKIERFCVLKGEALIQIRALFSNKILEFKVCGATPSYIDIPTMHTHNIKNIGNEELLTLFWTNEIFNPDLPDTYPEQV